MVGSNESQGDDSSDNGKSMGDMAGMDAPMRAERDKHTPTRMVMSNVPEATPQSKDKNQY